MRPMLIENAETGELRLDEATTRIIMQIAATIVEQRALGLAKPCWPNGWINRQIAEALLASDDSEVA